jgi:cyclopropane fatty-acyl-phospholipid synthase-like methyltransferase
MPMEPIPRATIDYDNPTAIRSLPTTAAYDLWAKHYDHDGNFLQALDTIEMKTLFPRLLKQLSSPSSSLSLQKPWKLVDLGCGTGRNTVALLGVPDAQVVAVDASEGMLDHARRRIAEAVPSTSLRDEVVFDIVDLLADDLPECVCQADAVVSTLVLEHIPCDVFFQKVARMLKPGGLLLLSNMHSHMGGISQAGFVDPETGEKIRPTSYAHTVDEVEKTAHAIGLTIVDSIKETAVDESLVEQLGPRSRKWVGVTCWFGGLFQKGRRQL